MPSFDDSELATLLADFMDVDTATGKQPRSQIVPVAAPIAAQEDAPPPSLRDMLAEQCAAEPERLPWPDDWFEGTDSAQVQACRDLWGAALIACIRTALGASGTTDSRPSALNVNLSSSWFRSKDFHMMCALAGLDGVACMDRLTDPARRSEMFAAFQGGAADGRRVPRTLRKEG